jgi:hypothetical protein
MPVNYIAAFQVLYSTHDYLSAVQFQDARYMRAIWDAIDIIERAQIEVLA